MKSSRHGVYGKGNKGLPVIKKKKIKAENQYSN